MNNDLISREDLKKKIQARYDNGEEDFDKGYNIGIETAMDLIDNAPTVEAFTKEDMAGAYNEGYACGGRENTRPQGEWIYHKAEGYFLPTMECSKCHASDLLGGLTRKEYKAVNKFCFNCGAQMVDFAQTGKKLRDNFRKGCGLDKGGGADD